MHHHKKRIRAAAPTVYCLAWVLLNPAPAIASAYPTQTTQTNQTHALQTFLNEAFDEPPPMPKYLWLTPTIQTQLKDRLGHTYPKARLRYWQQKNKRLWVLETIGKEKLITAAFFIQDSAIQEARIIAYREHRGYEIQAPRFLDQFKDLTLQPNRQLSHKIDSITGATLSVRAMRKMSASALYLNTQLTPSPSAS